MKAIMPNIWNLSLRLLLLALFAYIYQWPLQKIQIGQYLDNPTAFWIGFIAVSMFPAYLLWTLFGVFWVTFSEDNIKIRFHYFYKTVEVADFEIDSYFKTVQHTKVSKYKGLLIKLKTGKVVEVTEYNLKTVKGIANFLEASKTPFRGEKESWFPLKRRI